MNNTNKLWTAARGEPCALPLFLVHVQAGFPAPAEGAIESTLDLNAHLIKHPAATFFVRVRGDSMQCAGIASGDILIVDRALQAASGTIILAIVNGEFTVKRFLKKENKILLAPENPAYPLWEITEETDFQIWGVVTYVIHKAE